MADGMIEEGGAEGAELGGYDDSGSMVDDSFMGFIDGVEPSSGGGEQAETGEVPDAAEAPATEGAQAPADTPAPAPEPAKAEEGPGVAAPSAPEPPKSEADILRAQLQEAMVHIAATKATENSQAVAEAQKLELPKDEKDVTNLDWLQGEEPADYFESKEKFNALLNRVATVAARTGQAAGYEQAIRSIPQIVATSAQQHADLNTATSEFYAQNPDLQVFKKAVALAAQQVHAENPTMPLKSLFDEAGKRTREVMALRKISPAAKPALPTMVGGGASRTGGDIQLSAIQQQIDRMLNI
ncbi:MAG: hypothetical protein RR609_08270 [Aurantimicrobium sp.]